jgi:pyruvate/2-oxoglutarate/acetoin dehydrogenase E1 component
VTQTLSYHEARTRAVLRELEANPDALVIGHSLSLPFNADDALAARHPHQVVAPPSSELATAAAGVGAAMGGLRPLVALSTASFMFYAWPAVVNEAPLVRYLSAGAVQAPVAFHVHGGSRRGGGPQHEHSPQAMLQNVPGLRVLVPGTPADIDTALHAALTGPDPTVIFDHVLLADTRGPVPESPATVPAAVLLREGGDVLVVASGVMTPRALEAATELGSEGIEVAVLNVPMVAPAPLDHVLDVAGSYRMVAFADESRGPGSPASYLMAAVLEQRRDVRATLVCSAEAPAPFALHLLDEIVPTTSRIAAAVRELITGADR